MITDNSFQHLCNMQCPIKRPLDPEPFHHLGIEGYVPRKCALCPYLFEGECQWHDISIKESFESYHLKIIQSKCSGKDALHKALKKIIDKFALLPNCMRVLLVIEGDLAQITICDIHDIYDTFENHIKLFYSCHQEIEWLFGGVYPLSGGGVKISIIQALHEELYGSKKQDRKAWKRSGKHSHRK